MLFFAGHGETVEKQAPDPAEPGKTYTHRTGYLVPLDGPQNKPGEWINLDAFLDDIIGLPHATSSSSWTPARAASP